MAYYVYEKKSGAQVELGIVSRRGAVPRGVVGARTRSLVAAIELVGVRRARLRALGFKVLSFPGLEEPFMEMWGRANAEL